MEIVVITSPDKSQSEIPAVIELFHEGLITLHVRKPKFSTSKLREYIETIPEQYHNRVIIHSHHRLALRYNLKGIHLTKHHRKNAARLFFKLAWYRLRKPSMVITRSFHQIETLSTNRTKFSYAFINPYFSKIDPLKNSFDVNKKYLADSISKSRCPVYASGNINEENFRELKGMNLKGLAISKMIWKKQEKRGEFFRKIQEEIASW